MNNPNYKASKTRSNRPGWSATFKHPKRNDSRGRPGLKVRRGLGTADDGEADYLIKQLNELLSDQSWWSVDRRKEAELKYDPKVVGAFFDGIETGTISSAEIRDKAIELPTSEGYSRILFSGTTGAGKTTLLRQIIGTDHANDRFPSTSTGRTTTADIEIVTVEGSFDAVITFMAEHEVRAHVDECLEQACLNAIQGKSDEKVIGGLLSHSEQRFRLSYVLGSWRKETAGSEMDEFVFDDDEPVLENMKDDETVTSSDLTKNRKYLETVLERINDLSEKASESITSEFGGFNDQKNPEEKAVWLESFGNALYNKNDFQELGLDLMEDIRDRFREINNGEFEEGPTGWPISWIFKSDCREDFLQQVRWFSSNHHLQFGRLLTPLVDGLRVRGPFYPRCEEMEVVPKLVLLDGEGIGHSAKSVSSISTRITRRFKDVDLILIVDNAEQPMQNAPLELLRAIGNSGHGEKLAIAFTHFDLVKGLNLGSHSQKKDHVINSVRDAINTLRQSIGSSVAAALEERIEKQSYFLGGLDREINKIPTGFHKELARLLHLMQKSGVPQVPIEAAPIYRVEGLEIALRDAVEGFQEPWKARLGLQPRDGIGKEHWTRVKALARRLANGWNNNEYDSMRPVADLVASLQESISKWLDSPFDWTCEPANEQERNTALSSVRQAVDATLHDLAEKRLADTHRDEWLRAFDCAGRGSGHRRAERIEVIYEDAAPPVSSAMSESARTFLHQLLELVKDAVENSGGKFGVPAGEL